MRNANGMPEYGPRILQRQGFSPKQPKFMLSRALSDLSHADIGEESWIPTDLVDPFLAVTTHSLQNRFLAFQSTASLTHIEREFGFPKTGRLGRCGNALTKVVKAALTSDIFSLSTVFSRNFISSN